LGVAGLLVGAVAVVAVVDEDLEAEVARDLQRGVGGAVVDEDDEVDRVLRQLLVGEPERAARVVGGHHDDDLRLAQRTMRSIPSKNCHHMSSEVWTARRMAACRSGVSAKRMTMWSPTSECSASASSWTSQNATAVAERP